MKTMKKLLALCLAMLLTMSMPVFAEENAGNVLAVVNGVTLTVDTVAEEYLLYAGSLEGVADADAVLAAEKQELIANCVLAELERQKAEELGFMQFSETDMAFYRESAETQYETMLSYYMDFFTEDGLTDEEIRARTTAYFDEAGFTVDSILADSLQSAALEKLYEQVTQGVTMDDAELETYYQQRVEADKAAYAENLYTFEYALFGESAITYIPEGFRTVSTLLVSFDEETTYQLYDLMLAREEAEEGSEAYNQIQAQIDGLIAPTLEVIARIQSRLEAGEDFKTLIAEYDESSLYAGIAPTDAGYYVSADSVVWPAEFVEAAMALTQPGEISQPVVLDYGIYLLRYEGEVASGAVPLENIHDALMQEAMDSKKEQAYQDAQAEWYAQADITLYPENLDAVLNAQKETVKGRH